MKITDEMLVKAMEKAIEFELIPKESPLDQYELYWSKLRKILEAALGHSLTPH